jgi:preprotein translocase subunit SecG
VRCGTSDAATHYSIMKKTTRKPLNRMTIFVISIFILAAVIAAVYLVGFTPGEV